MKTEESTKGLYTRRRLRARREGEDGTVMSHGATVPRIVRKGWEANRQWATRPFPTVPFSYLGLTARLTRGSSLTTNNKNNNNRNDMDFIIYFLHSIF